MLLAFGDVQNHVDSGGGGPLVKARRVIDERFDPPGVDVERREFSEVGI